MNKQERQKRMHQLDEQIRVCVKCPLHKGRTIAVPGEGPVPADVFIVGEAPGAKEDRQGRPFVGPSGMILEQLLEVAGLTRTDVYVTSCVKCRPPQNRTPRTLELDTCQENWLNRQIDLVDPKVLVLLGKVAISQLLQEEGSLRDLHGQTVERDGRLYLMTYHPAAAFRVPETKEIMKQDMATLKQLVGRHSPSDRTKIALLRSQ
jgi:uracil-DNA glycosylase family 4